MPHRSGGRRTAPAPGLMLAAAMALIVLLPLPGAATSGRLTVGDNPPRIDIRSSVAPEAIWPEGSGGEPGEAQVSIGLAAAGDPSFTFEPQDTVFVMDRSGSMELSDPAFIRVTATQKYVDMMVHPDQGAVVSFADNATLVGDHVGGNYSAIKKALATVRYASGTNFESAISAATDELLLHGNRSHKWIEILLTDGIPEPAGANLTPATAMRTAQANITVYTIGLGAQLDEPLLQWLAGLTGGTYFHAMSASELEAIYLNISNGYRNFTAGTDIRVREVLSPGVQFVPGSALPWEDASGTIPVPGGELTFIDWTVPRMNLSQSWNATYRVTVSGAGYHPLRANRTAYGDDFARVDHIDWSGQRAVLPLPDMALYGILPIPPPPPAFMPPAVAPPPPPPPPPPLLPVYSPAVPVAVQPNIIMVTQSSPPLFVFAPLLGLGAGRLLQKVKPTKLRGMGMVSPKNRRKVRELVRERDKHEL